MQCSFLFAPGLETPFPPYVAMGIAEQYPGLERTTMNLRTRENACSPVPSRYDLVNTVDLVDAEASAGVAQSAKKTFPGTKNRVGFPGVL